MSCKRIIDTILFFLISLLINTIDHGICITTIGASFTKPASFDVKLELVAPWPHVSLLAETVEFVSDIKDSNVLLLLQLIAPYLDKQYLSQYYDRCIKEHKKETIELCQIHHAEEDAIMHISSKLFISPYTGPLMSLTIYNHYYSPRVEFIRTLERDLKQYHHLSSTEKICNNDTWIALCIPQQNGKFLIKTACSNYDTLLSFIPQSIQPTMINDMFVPPMNTHHPCHLLKFDHFLVPFPYVSLHTETVKTSQNHSSSIFYIPRQQHLPYFILFSSLIPGYASLSTALDFIARQNQFPVIFRHGDTIASLQANNTNDYLTGYGAELVVKNPEYTTTDEIYDLATLKNGIIKPTESDKQHMIEEEIIEDIDMFQQDVNVPKKSFDVDRILSVPEIQKLGLRAVTEINQCCIEHNNTDCGYCQLHKLFQLSSNFPNEAVRLSEGSIPSSVTLAVKRLQKKIYERANIITINHFLFNRQQGPSFFPTLFSIGKYLVGLELLMRHGMTLSQAIHIIQQRSSFFQEDTLPNPFFSIDSLPGRLDWRDNQLRDRTSLPINPIWDVTIHPSTSHWPIELDKFFIIMMLRGPLNVRAPLHHILIIFDPFDTIQLDAALSYLDITLAMRLYLFPIPSQCLQLPNTKLNWDEHIFGPIPNDLSNNLTNPLYHTITTDSLVCHHKSLVTDLYLRLLTPKRGSTIKERLRSIDRARQFLFGLKKKLTLLNHIDIIHHTQQFDSILLDLFNHYGGQHDFGTQVIDHRTQHFNSTITYIKKKGLITNIIVFNGKIMELKSLRSTMIIPSQTQRQDLKPIELSNVIYGIAMQEQQLVISSLMMETYTLPNDATSVFLEKNSVPTCLLPHNYFHDVTVNYHSICSCIYWDDLTSKSSGTLASHSQFFSWDAYTMIGRTDSMALHSKTHPLISLELLHQYPKRLIYPTYIVQQILNNNDLSNSTIKKTWPISWTIIADWNPQGLELISSVYKHFIASLNRQSSLALSFPTLHFTYNLQIAFINQHDQTNFNLEKKLVTHILMSLLDQYNQPSSLSRVVFKPLSFLELSYNFISALRMSLGHSMSTTRIEALFQQVLNARLMSLTCVTNGCPSEHDITQFNHRIVSLIKQNPADTMFHKDLLQTHSEATLLNIMYDAASYFPTDTVPIPSMIINQRLLLLSESILDKYRLEEYLDFVEVAYLRKEINLFVTAAPSHTYKHHGRTHENITNLIPSIQLGDHSISPDILSYASVIRERLFQQQDYWEMTDQLFNDIHSTLKIRLPPSNRSLPSPLTFHAVIDPLSTYAQIWAETFYVLNRVLNIDILIILNPAVRLKEYPLNRWFRQVIAFPKILSLNSGISLNTHLMTDNVHDDTHRSSNVPSAFFKQLTTNHTLTVGLHVPDNWVVRAQETQHDLDNLRPIPEMGHQLLSAIFLLNDLYFEGHASVGSPHDTKSLSSSIEILPIADESLAGLQLSLKQEHQWCPVKAPQHEETHLTDIQISDTIVMGNLGYFQLHSHPGLFWLHLENHTQHTTGEFIIRTWDHTVSTPRTIHDHTSLIKTVPIICNSLLARTHQLQIIQIMRKEHMTFSSGSLMSWKSYFAYNAKSNILQKSIYELTTALSSIKNYYVFPHSVPSTCNERIHVFSLASGFMYERLLRIMILSVRRHTSCPLTFWFVANFLSSKFRQIMPAMAERYNLRYHFVTYKWPFWLRKQTEKQRQIWAYKILFLDVLFPNNVRKVIYIDADQVVRADIHQLWTMNLHGHVYAFTPFCDSNKETNGLRFWNQGYWKNHLAGKPYHISALFVVDLVKFRELKAGDMLRSIYMTLSQDKNSLANLDQDLPNFAQHQTPIFSLPQDWLWCETWCSRDSLATAKTVDLCNNPMTKEPKLSQARRILPEWITYDAEIRDLEMSVLEDSSNVLTTTTTAIGNNRIETETTFIPTKTIVVHNDEL